MYDISDWPIPTPKPARQAIPSDVNPANSAAANAGTTKSTSVLESACARGAATMPMAPASADASTVLAIDSWFGERPASMPYTSFSAAARVARPNRVHRYRPVRTSAMSSTMPAIQNLFAGIDAPKTSTMLFGKTLGICFDAEPNHSSTVAWRISRIPSEATSLASGDDVRSGRKTSNSLSTPTRTDTTIVTSDSGSSGQREAEVVGLQCPECVRGDHRHRAGGQIDDAGSAVRDDHGHGDPGDHRARPEAEQDEERNVLHARSSSTVQPRGG